MAISALTAGRSLCQMRDWRVTNLELQKILYIAHMFYLGRHDGEPLIRENFEAWDYGPVVPELYRRVRGFGDHPVRNVFHWIDDLAADTSEYQLLNEASDATKDMRPGKLIAITHWEQGAWARVYRPGERGIKIPNGLILEEYRAREA